MQAIETAASYEIPSRVDADLLNIFAEYQGINDAEEVLDQFEDCYQGIYSSLKAWAEELLSQTGELDAIPANLRYYFGFSAYARDCELSGDIMTIETSRGVAVFWFDRL